MRAIHVNGKFLAQGVTGVQRVARNALRAVDEHLAAVPAAHPPWVLWCPPSAQLPALRQVQTRVVGPRGLALHLWEQVVLPMAARGGLLLNLAGSAPMWGRGQVCTIHDAAVFDHPEAYTTAFVCWYRALFRRQAAQAARLLTVSNFSRTRLASCLGVAPDRLAVVPNGGDHLDRVIADDSVLARYALRGRRYLLAVGSANPNKNLGRLVAALALVQDEPELRLVIVGGRNDGVFASAGRPPDDPRVVCTGTLSDAPLKALYAHALALVFPSLYEGFGLPPLEAMACGCPVAAARAASMPEVCGDAALYFDPTSVADIARALRRLLVDDALRRQLAAAGAVRVRAYRWAGAADTLLSEVEALA